MVRKRSDTNGKQFENPPVIVQTSNHPQKVAPGRVEGGYKIYTGMSTCPTLYILKCTIFNIFHIYIICIIYNCIHTVYVRKVA